MAQAALPRQAQAQLDEAEEITRLIAEEMNPQPADPKEPAVVVVTEPEVIPRVPEDDWQGRYHSLQGKYDAEVPRLHHANSELGSEVRTLSDQVAQLTAQIKTPPPAEAAVPSSISAKDEEAFGSDLIDLQRRVVAEAMAKVQPVLDRLQHENTDLRQQVTSLGTKTEKTSAELFHDRLTEAVPDWRAVDAKQGWLNWLAETDPMSGLTRQTYLRNAITQMDVSRTASIFQAYKALNGAAPFRTKAANTVSAELSDPPDTLESQVTPSRSAAPANAQTPQGAEGKRIWTGKDVSVALDPRRLRKMTDAQQAAVFSEIDAAQSEGRVIP